LNKEENHGGGSRREKDNNFWEDSPPLFSSQKNETMRFSLFLPVIACLVCVATITNAVVRAFFVFLIFCCFYILSFFFNSKWNDESILAKLPPTPKKTNPIGFV
jgi:hypothetical protein